LNTPAFLRSATSGTIFAVENGVRRKVSNTALLAELAGGAPVVLVSVNSTFLLSLQVGPEITPS
jgi:hypothetical protein